MASESQNKITNNAGYEARQLIRSEKITSHTSGLANDCVQGNLVILHEKYAKDFLLYCQRNPKPCPILGVTDIGNFDLPTLGKDIDIRTDLPKYRIWENGQLTNEVSNIKEYWHDQLVAFVIGCSFSFEQALIEAQIPLRHIEQKINVAMYQTNIETSPAGIFHGTMVVSMRPLKSADAIRAIQICTRFPNVHGAPVHIGDPSLIGIKDIMKPEFGDPVEIKHDEIPVFWACGVTPQAAVMASKPEFCITHAPGSMLITDIKNNMLATF